MLVMFLKLDEGVNKRAFKPIKICSFASNMSTPKINIVNRRASHDYFFLDTYEAGISLMGSEIKAIREGRVNLTEAFGFFKKGELYIRNMHIGEYSHGSAFVHEPRRMRKLLLHRSELRKIEKKLKEQGNTLIVVRLFINESGFAKVEIAIAKGKKNYDKRESLKKKEAKRSIARAQRSKY